MTLLSQFQAHLTTTQLFAADDRLLLAISGGLDSVVLLDLLLQNGYRPALAHCNFQLRGEASTADAAFVAGLADTHGLILHEKVFDTIPYAASHGLSVQMAARELRYAWFEELVQTKAYDRVLTAHHFDDSLETFLLNFLRGTGLKGLGGIPPVRDHYRRPLLFAPRADLEAYQQSRGLTYREDESNAKDDYSRNYLRHHVLPKLYELQPDLGTLGPANFARIQLAQAFLQAQLAALKSTYCASDEQGREVFDRLAIVAHPQAELLLWEWFAPLGFTAEQIRQLQHSQSGTVLQASPWEVLVTASAWLLQTSAPKLETDWGMDWPAELANVVLPDGRHLRQERAGTREVVFPTNASVKVYVSAAELQYPLRLRYRQAGDVFCPLGMDGRHQKLKDFFINQKIDRWQRDGTPLLVNGDGRIIWVVGHRLDERFRVEENEQVVRFQLHA